MIVAILIIANGVLIGFQTDPKYQDWEGFSSLELFIQCLGDEMSPKRLEGPFTVIGSITKRELKGLMVHLPK